MNNKEFKLVIFKLLMLGSICGGLVFFGVGKISKIEDTEEVSKKLFSENREVIWVKSDSLLKYLDILKTSQPNVFEIEKSNSEITFRALDEKPFNTVFLDGEYISRYEKKHNLGIKKLSNGYGFSLKIEEKNNVLFVKIPAEVIQSILINK